jgi:hypothetical protein
MMRGISLLLLGATLASCAAEPPPPMQSAKAERQYDQFIAGRVAGPAVSCMPTFNANDMVVLNDSTVGFKVGGRVYVAHAAGGCNNLGGPYALVTRQPAGTRLCSGDVIDIVDVRNHFTVGSCSFSEFTPYDRTGR